MSGPGTRVLGGRVPGRGAALLKGLGRRGTRGSNVRVGWIQSRYVVWRQIQVSEIVVQWERAAFLIWTRTALLGGFLLKENLTKVA